MMRKSTKLAVMALGFLFGIVALAGCKQTTSTAPLAPGFNNATDQTIGEVLASAHAAYTRLQQDVVAGKWTPSATEKTALNSFALALNTADSTYLAYHNGTATLAQAQAAAQTVTDQQTALESTLGTGVK